ncbi:MAG: 7-cyano-7-deazaguanine synthase QueC [Phycisphaeraceae bacterium]|nr:7-cyano-7-deazaguanine synthase QueC [Phycisphaeraceae bacterium]MCB9848286.1 7-cyano-7-deazaguanine synthase QueC [Phycisphaeraceae bacterium]
MTASIPPGDAHESPRTPAVVLLSGGLDSATTLAIAMSDGFDCHALVFEYGQRHRVELEAADRVARTLGAASITQVHLDPDAFLGSALTTDLAVPKDRAPETLEPHDAGDIPVTYVPARNLVFLSYATALAESLGASDIYLGVNAVDYSGYPDCRPEFIDAFQRAAQLATRAGAQGATLHIHAPLISWTKAQIIRRGVELGVDYALTHSCYDPDGQGRACGHCDSCLLRKAGFERAGVADPTIYSPA